VTIASDLANRPRPHTIDVGLAASQVSTSTWKRVAHFGTVTTISVATVVGVSMGLAAPAVSPVAPVIAAAPATTDATATAPQATTIDATVTTAQTASDHHHDDGRGDDGHRR
jgi:hypothetical protein